MKNNLRAMRAAVGLTQDDLAKKVTVTRQTINALESGKYDPSIELAFKISRYFKTTIEEIFIYEKMEDYK
jgi:putative transcriptional regulator